MSARQRGRSDWAALLGIAASLVAMSIAAVSAAAPASACTHADDVNVLCSNEQAFVNDLATVGVTPTRTPRIMVNQGNTLCGQLASGVPRDVLVQKVYGGAAMRLDQAQAIVAAAVDHLCGVGAAPGPNHPSTTRSTSYLAGFEIGAGTQSDLRAEGHPPETAAEARESCELYTSNAASLYGVHWQGGVIAASNFNQADYLDGCLTGAQQR
ncbi:DUF732 domain-containing protein [Mycobacterium sp. MBM]|nr:DUF732 domain-containing protein [Mycobacterium sp. MBM]